jgi:hypothetical protein
MRHPSRLLRAGLFAALLALIAFPAHGAGQRATAAPGFLSHLSQSVQLRYYLAHPEFAPPQFAEQIQAVEQLGAGALDRAEASRGAPYGDLFNRDDVGFPQNEEAVTVCENQPRYVLSGANDYRGLLDRQVNFSGWYFSDDGGRSVLKEGLLPALPNQGRLSPSGGDPAIQSDDRCRLYYANLNFTDPSEGPNGIGVYMTKPSILERCPQGQDPDQLTRRHCWPNGRIVASAATVGGRGRFLDKEWLDVGRSGAAGNVVWIAYSDFTLDPDAPLGFTGAQIKAVRCDAHLDECTRPILISGADKDIQFADVTISETGRTMITWAQITGELEETAQTFTVKMRIAEPGSTEFGPTQVVNEEFNPLPFGGFLHANDFRTATYPKSIMPVVHGHERQFVVWDRCRFRLLDTVCEEPQIVMSYSDNDGRSWSRARVLSKGGDNYFPAISDEVGSPNFAVAYYTNRYDRVFHNRQDVEVLTIDKATGEVVNRQRVTRTSNETEADPILGGFFIGDYIDVHLLGGTAYVAYNANARHVRVLGQGRPIPQQDNFLTRIQS